MSSVTDIARTEADYRYINRDLSWIEFNRRVLEEAQDEGAPLMERLKFLSIVSSNLDEFMSVRVAGVMDQIKAGYVKQDFSGLTPSELLKQIIKRTSGMVAEQYRTYRALMRELAKEQLCFVSYDDLNQHQKKVLDSYFHDIVFPVLTPMAVDQSRPFPLVHSLGLYLAVVLRRNGSDDENELYFAIVQVPSILSRTVEAPARTNSRKKEFIELEQLIKQHIHTLFSGYTPVSVHGFRMTRNADLTLNEEGAEDLLEEIEKELRKRRWGLPVRMEAEQGMHPFALQMLTEEFELKERNIFMIDGPLDLTFFMKFAGQLKGHSALAYPPLEPVFPREFLDNDDPFAVLRQQDVLAHHPYESFEAVNELIDRAASDPDVLAIKMTLYRVSGKSEIVAALARAAEAGKQVTVVVELKARFDEERNIAWARKLEQAGCHVVYGLVGLKTHAKILLIIRAEAGELMRYVHISTGNYNDNTARLYTDVGLFTTHSRIGEDASALFNEITGYSDPPHHWQAFAVAPTDLQLKLFELIRRECEHAAAGRPARIIAKMNSLSNQQMVNALYAASRAGVAIDLIVRGLCCLRPEVPGLSENIRVISIVDRFLEHSRVFYFRNGGEDDVYISSADWMSRNLTRRIELICPVFDPKVKGSLINLLHMYLQDNVKARRLTPTGKYVRVHNELPPFRSQFEAIDIEKWKL